MPNSIARRFSTEIESFRNVLKGLPPQLAETPFRAGGWTRKQLLGHLLDSATNNRQRFVRAAIDGAYAGPSYQQNTWVEIHGYEDQPWETLLRWWVVEHEILAAVVDRIPEDRLGVSCTVGSDAPVTLRYLIEDYLRHHRHHIGQMGAVTD